jgi:[glutamine synthetase] adenylyltransferase / [glutamine synthetase]-adenylyl-L-tyrosine phosphorylase
MSRTTPNVTRTDRAGEHLRSLERIVVTSGSSVTPARFRRMLGTRLRRSTGTELLLARMLRFIEAVPTSASLLTDLFALPPLLDVLTAVLDSSQYFADILTRNPGYFRWLTGTDALLHPLRSEDLDREIQRVLGMFSSPVRVMDSLKRLHRREMLRIGARDLLGEADLAATTADLSVLADAMIRAAFTVAGSREVPMTQRGGAPLFAVVALGKLGGGELNYSSDVDLMVIHGDEDPAGPGGTAGIHEQVIRLAGQAIRFLTETTGEGHLYRVDMRLRPEGNAGPLALSLGAALLYYEARGELWERQMLLKARPVAGDLVFGRRCLDRLVPFVYPRTLLQSPTESITRIKASIEASLEGEENVKLGPGGIRDIEFTVQALQLLNGGRNPAVRSGNTMEAIQRLAEARLLTTTEARTLSEAYVFLRTVEHRLQMEHNMQTHQLPADAGALQALARRMKMDTAAKFRGAYRRHTRAVRRIFDRVLAPPASQEELDLSAIAGGNVPSATVERFLAAHGFRDVRGSARALASLLHGASLSGGATLESRPRDLVRRHAVPIITTLAATPLPDRALAALAALAEGPAVRDILYRELADPGFRNVIVTLCARYPLWSRTAKVHPELFDTVVRLASPRDEETGAEDQDTAAARRSGELRAGARYALGLTDIREFTREVSAAAETVIRRIHRRVGRRNSSQLVVFALGKFGTGELLPGADLDLLCIAGEGKGRERAENLATAIIGELSAVSGGAGYTVDMRLRPEGKNAPLVIEQKAYLKYLLQRASLWERQSLTRLRPVSGDPELAGRILDDVKGFVYRSPLPSGWTSAIVEMRRRMESRSRVRTGRILDLKLGPGGMVDVEFIMQMMLLAAGPAGERFHALPVYELLELDLLPHLQAGERRMLQDAYRLFRETEAAMRLTLEQHGAVLPEGEKLDMLARFMRGESAREFFSRCTSTMNSVRRTFLDVAQRTGELSPERPS